MEKQTAVEWLATQVANFPTMENLRNNIKLIVEEAKEMERIQMKEMYLKGEELTIKTELDEKR